MGLGTRYPTRRRARVGRGSYPPLARGATLRRRRIFHPECHRERAAFVVVGYDWSPFHAVALRTAWPVESAHWGLDSRRIRQADQGSYTAVGGSVRAITCPDRRPRVCKRTSMLTRRGRCAAYRLPFQRRHNEVCKPPRHTIRRSTFTAALSTTLCPHCSTAPTTATAISPWKITIIRKRCASATASSVRAKVRDPGRCYPIYDSADFQAAGTQRQTRSRLTSRCRLRRHSRTSS